MADDVRDDDGFDDYGETTSVMCECVSDVDESDDDDDDDDNDDDDDGDDDDDDDNDDGGCDFRLQSFEWHEGNLYHFTGYVIRQWHGGNLYHSKTHTTTGH